MRPGEAHGFTLFELVLAIAIVSVAMAAIVGTFATVAKGSGDTLVRQQAQLVAQAYLEEILLKKFYDPDTNDVCPTPEANRKDYDNVCDYRSVDDSPPKDPYGNDVLTSKYRATVTVTRDATVVLNGITNSIAGPPNDLIKVLKVDVTVTVTEAGSASITLTGYRTNYNCEIITDAGCKQL